MLSPKKSNLDGKSTHHSVIDPNASTSVGNSANGTPVNGTSGSEIAPSPNVEDITRVSVRASPFWRANPALWFCQLEAQFAMNRITADKAKYYAVVSAIESTILDQVSDVVLHPPPVNLYATLKSKLLDVLAESEQSRLKKLLGEIELGDNKPSFLYRKMKNLAGDSMNLDLIKTLWLQHLPSNIQAILSISSESVDRLVIIADKIHETTSGFEVSKININPTESLIEKKIV